MKIRSIYFHNFRTFRGEVSIDFCDPLTLAPRPISVLAGTNGSGKTTILESIEALLAYAVNPDQPADLVKEAWDTGFIVLEVAFTAGELDGSSSTDPPETIVHIAVGRTDLRPPGFHTRWPNLICRFVARGTAGRDYIRLDRAATIQKSINRMLQRQRGLAGGLLFFPSTRRLAVTAGGAIEPPPEVRRWIDRVEDQHGWAGSLEQLWVWQNYLDLEQGQGRDSIRPFVEHIEHTLGPNRRIAIRQGRVFVTSGDRKLPPVRVDALPSGEKQILFLLGELARRGRMGMVCLLDEPEISLHPALQHSLIHYLRAYARESDAQFILATHSLEILSALPGAEILIDHLQHYPTPQLHQESSEAA